MDKINYRYVRSVSGEGFIFDIVLRYVAHFYKDIMHGRVRRDGPGSLLKYSRDWEYPWVLLISQVKPDDKVLDCGSGYSPLPFIWSEFGAEVHALDRDIMICSRFKYIFFCFRMIFLDLLKFPLVVFNKIRRNKEYSAIIKRCSRFLYLYFIDINLFRISRIFKSDFWGPIPPALLRRYSIDYKKGDIVNLPYRDGFFDLVNCISVLEHMPYQDRIKSLMEMSRVTRKGGKLIITYDKEKEDLTDSLIQDSGMILAEAVYFKKPDNLYDKNKPDVIGLCLIKQ